MTRYYIEDTPLKPAALQRLMRFRDGEFPEEYDFRSRQWKTNKELGQIYYGGIEVNTISAREAEAIINARNSEKNL